MTSLEELEDRERAATGDGQALRPASRAAAYHFIQPLPVGVGGGRIPEKIPGEAWCAGWCGHICTVARCRAIRKRCLLFRGRLPLRLVKPSRSGDTSLYAFSHVVVPSSCYFRYLWVLRCLKQLGSRPPPPVTVMSSIDLGGPSSSPSERAPQPQVTRTPTP